MEVPKRKNFTKGDIKIASKIWTLLSVLVLIEYWRFRSELSATIHVTFGITHKPWRMLTDRLHAVFWTNKNFLYIRHTLEFVRNLRRCNASQVGQLLGSIQFRNVRCGKNSVRHTPGPFMFQKTQIQMLLIYICTSFQGVKLWTPLNNLWIVMQNI